MPSTAKSTNTRTFSNFNPLAPSSSHSLSNLSVVPTPKFATFFYSLPNALPGSHFYLHFNPMPPLLPTMHRPSLSSPTLAQPTPFLTLPRKPTQLSSSLLERPSILPFLFNLFFVIFSFRFSWLSFSFSLFSFMLTSPPLLFLSYLIVKKIILNLEQNIFLKTMKNLSCHRF